MDLIDDCGDESLIFFDDHAMFSVLQKKDITEGLHLPLCPDRVIRFDQVFLDAFSRLGADPVFIVEDDRNGSGGHAKMIGNLSERYAFQ